MDGFLRDGRLVYFLHSPDGRMVEVNRWSAHVCPGTGMHNPEGEAECEAIARLFQHAPNMLEALDKLARLGNGFEYGNSEGNLIAQAAIAKVKGR